MMKRVILLVIIVCIFLSLVSCSNKASEQEQLIGDLFNSLFNVSAEDASAFQPDDEVYIQDRFFSYFTKSGLDRFMANRYFRFALTVYETEGELSLQSISISGPNTDLEAEEVYLVKGLALYSCGEIQKESPYQAQVYIVKEANIFKVDSLFFFSFPKFDFESN